MIAIPAYQNYTIRARVTEGLTLADGFKTAIGEYYANTGNWPAISNLSGVQASIGKYESGVTVLAGGQIQITYGNQANKAINASTLSLTPYVNANNDVLWRCGLATAPSSATAPSAATTGTSTVPAQYLPIACHS